MHSPSDDQLAAIVWDYHLLGHGLEPCDVLCVLGSSDPRVADWSAEVYERLDPPWVVFSGATGRLTEKLYEKTEAETFAERAAAGGIPHDRILLETRSRNTGENLRFTREVLAARGVSAARILIATKPYMERRAFATTRCVWPEVEVRVTSPPIPYADYPAPPLTRRDVIHLIVGDLQRIELYPALGFQVEQEIPTPVRDAFEELVRRGYDQQLVR